MHLFDEKSQGQRETARSVTRMSLAIDTARLIKLQRLLLQINLTISLAF